MEIIKDCEQGSPEWFAMRLGSIGGSSISSVVAGGKGKTRASLLYRLAGEILSGEKYEGFQNEHMLRGIEQESDARTLYEFMTDTEVKQVALVRTGSDDGIHYSPDGLVGDAGLIEIKSTIASVHVETVITEKIPGTYYKQIQWGLHVCDRQWCDFISFSPTVIDRPIWVKRQLRDVKTIGELVYGAHKFKVELAEIVQKIKGA